MATLQFTLNVGAVQTASGVVTINLGGTNYVYDPATGTNMGNYVDPQGRFTMSCVRVTRTDCPLRLDFRAIAGWQCVVVEYGDPLATSGVQHLKGANGQPAYTATMPDNSVVSVPNHYWLSRWRWQSNAWPLPMATIASLTSANLLPSFNKALALNAVPYPAVPAYTPMTLAGLTPFMGQTGGRPDIGIVTDWQADYICNQTATGLANVLAQGEAGGTWQWMFRDLSTGSLLDIFNTYPNASLYNNGGASPLLAMPSGTTTCQLTITGPANTWIGAGAGYNGPVVVSNGLTGTAYQEFWLYGAWNNSMNQAAIQIPASGTLTMGATVGSLGNGQPPTGPLQWVTGGVPAGCTPAYVDGSWDTGVGFSLDSAHMPALAYLPFLLSGDPYFLEILQCQVLYSFLEQPRGSGAYAWPTADQTRGMAWSLRNIMQAVKVTPASVPSWLLSQAVMQQGLTQTVNAGTGIMNDGSGRANFGFLDVVWGARDDGSYLASTYIEPWEGDFLLAILAWGKQMGFTQLDPFLVFNIPFFTNRLNNTSGWPQGIPEVYELQVRPNATSPVYATWTAMWDANAALLGINPASPPALVFNSPNEFDYPEGMYVGLALAVQAGHSEAQAARDTLLSALQAGIGAVSGVGLTWNRALA